MTTESATIIVAVDRISDAWLRQLRALDFVIECDDVIATIDLPVGWLAESTTTNVCVLGADLQPIERHRRDFRICDTRNRLRVTLWYYLGEQEGEMEIRSRYCLDESRIHRLHGGTLSTHVVDRADGRSLYRADASFGSHELRTRQAEVRRDASDWATRRKIPLDDVLVPWD